MGYSNMKKERRDVLNEKNLLSLYMALDDNLDGEQLDDVHVWLEGMMRRVEQLQMDNYLTDKEIPPSA
jgi:hypothetical protein